MSSLKPATRFVLACIFMDALGFGLIIPVLPRLIGDLAGTRDLQTYWYGAIMVSYGIMQFLSSPILGALSDRFGRKPVLLTGIFGLSIMQFVPAFTSSLPLVLASRIAGGMLSANLVVAQAYIADITPKQQRSAAFGKIGAVYGLAFVIGPALGGILGQIDPRIPFAFAGAICCLNFIYGFFVLPESLTTPDMRPWTFRRFNPFIGIIALLKVKPIIPMVLIIGLIYLSQSLMQYTWALYTEFRYGWTPLNIGLSMFVLGLCIAFTQGWLLPALIRVQSEKHLVIAALSIGCLALAGIGFTAWGIVAAILAWTFSLLGIASPIIQSAVSRQVSPTMQGSAMGAISSLNSFSGAIAPVISTPLLVYTAKGTDELIPPGIPYYLAASLLLLSVVIALIARRQFR